MDVKLMMMMMMEALSREFTEGLPMELLYADDLVLMAQIQPLADYGFVYHLLLWQSQRNC